MASPGELTKAIAKALGVPEVTVVLHDRNLVAAGLRSKGGRGRSAAKMTAVDAANLLIGVDASSMVKDTVEVVEEYSSLPSKGGDLRMRQDASSYDITGNPPTNWNLSGFPLPAMQELPPEHTFRDALVALINAGIDGSLEAAVRSIPPQETNGYSFPPWWDVEVFFRGPSPQATIAIRCSDFQETHHYSTLPGETDDLMKWAQKNYENYGGDLSQTREFTARTIFSLADLLKN